MILLGIVGTLALALINNAERSVADAKDERKRMAVRAAVQSAFSFTSALFKNGSACSTWSSADCAYLRLPTRRCREYDPATGAPIPSSDPFTQAWFDWHDKQVAATGKVDGTATNGASVDVEVARRNDDSDPWQYVPVDGVDVTTPHIKLTFPHLPDNPSDKEMKELFEKGVPRVGSGTQSAAASFEACIQKTYERAAITGNYWSLGTEQQKCRDAALRETAAATKEDESRPEAKRVVKARVDLLGLDCNDGRVTGLRAAGYVEKMPDVRNTRGRAAGVFVKGTIPIPSKVQMPACTWAGPKQLKPGESGTFSVTVDGASTGLDAGPYSERVFLDQTSGTTLAWTRELSFDFGPAERSRYVAAVAYDSMMQRSAWCYLEVENATFQKPVPAVPTCALQSYETSCGCGTFYISSIGGAWDRLDYPSPWMACPPDGKTVTFVLGIAGEGGAATCTAQYTGRACPSGSPGDVIPTRDELAVNIPPRPPVAPDPPTKIVKVESTRHGRDEAGFKYKVEQIREEWNPGGSISYYTVVTTYNADGSERSREYASGS